MTEWLLHWSYPAKRTFHEHIVDCKHRRTRNRCTKSWDWRVTIKAALLVSLWVVRDTFQNNFHVQCTEKNTSDTDDTSSTRIFRKRTNPLDYLNDTEVIERYRLPRVFLYTLVDLVNADIQKMTRPDHCLLQYRCWNIAKYESEMFYLWHTMRISIHTSANVIVI